MQEKLENYLDAFANGNAWWKNVSLLHFRWIGTSNLWCQFDKMTGKLFSSLFTTTFFKMQTVFPYFYRSWWPQKISLKRNMYSPFIFKTVFCTIFWGVRSLPLAMLSLKISWKYPQIVSSEDRAKHCFYKWMEFSKGQIISEQNCGVLNFPKKQRNYCENFCPSL